MIVIKKLLLIAAINYWVPTGCQALLEVPFCISSINIHSCVKQGVVLLFTDEGEAGGGLQASPYEFF